MRRRCKSKGCKAELTDPSKGYCSQHIYSVERLNDTVQYLLRRYEIEKLENKVEEHAEHSADI